MVVVLETRLWESANEVGKVEDVKSALDIMKEEMK